MMRCCFSVSLKLNRLVLFVSRFIFFVSKFRYFVSKFVALL